MGYFASYVPLLVCECGRNWKGAQIMQVTKRYDHMNRRCYDGSINSFGG